MNINISNANGEPIYLQIANQIKTLILEGKLREGDMLPSMRNLAMELRISFMTTKRAYEELERDGFITTMVGRGSFVAESNTEVLKEEQLRIVEQKLEDAVEHARKSGVSLEELREIMEMLYRS